MTSTPNRDLLARVSTVLGTADLDCACRDRLDAALSRFEALERRRSVRSLLHAAREGRDQVAALADLLLELHGLGTEEPDISVFEECALLFESIVDVAAQGAADMRRLSRVVAGGDLVER
jgi:hypothetical protein